MASKIAADWLLLIDQNKTFQLIFILQFEVQKNVTHTLPRPVDNDYMPCVK